MITTAPNVYHTNGSAVANAASANPSSLPIKDNVEFMLQQTEAATSYLSSMSKMLPWPLNTAGQPGSSMGPNVSSQNAFSQFNHHNYGSALAALAASSSHHHHHNIDAILGGYKTSLNGQDPRSNGYPSYEGKLNNPKSLARGILWLFNLSN